MIAALEGTDLWIVLAVVLVLFGGSQLPKLARSIGSASHEFRKGIDEGSKGGAEDEGGSSSAGSGASGKGGATTADSNTAESTADAEKKQ